MKSGGTNDPILRILARLPSSAPSAAQDARVRARCHAVLAQSHERRAQFKRSAALAARLVEAALIAGLCVYFSAVIREAFRLGGL
jgi:hypothetical protein